MARRLATRPRIAVAVGAGVLVLAGWWVVRAPAVERAVALPPAPDLDPPALRGRRDEAIALAEAPDDPWTFAESLAASGAASAAEPVKEACGQDDGPRYRLPAADGDSFVQTRGASPQYAGAQARVDAQLRASADPLDHAAADLANAGDMRDAAGRDEAVVAQAAATSDARVYALGYGLCHAVRSPAPSCSSISLERWTQIDPDNGVPWLSMLAEAKARGDAVAVREAMRQLASSSRFDVYVQQSGAAIARRAANDDPELAAVHELSFRAESEEASLPMPPYEPLIDLCRDGASGDEGLAAQCRTVGDAMFAHSDTLMGLSISGALLLATTGDASRRDAIRAERALAASHWSPATGISSCRDIREEMARTVHLAQVGEVEAMREQARKFVPP